MLSRINPRVLLAFATLLSAGCTQDPAGAPAPAQMAVVETAPVALAWQEQARNLVGATRLNALAGGRVYAALSVAQHRAVKAADDATGGGRAQLETRRGAVAGASARVLGFLFPAAAGALEDMVEEQANAGPGDVHPHFTRGVADGRTAGDAIVAHLQTDGFTAPWNGTVPTGPGIFVPLAIPPGGGMLGQVKPYFLTSGAQFRPGPPPAFGSTAFTADLNEVITRTQNITPEEIVFARFWDYSAGSPTPPGFWNEVADDYVAENLRDERAATEVFSLMHSAMFDALIACWDAKYHYWVIRPSQASSAVTLSLPLPNFPAYPSGHSCVSASAARVLTQFFPDKSSELSGWVNDAGLSRILAGIHFRFDITAGQALGRTVAEYALSRGAL
jgi:hypothetical protein